jgi:hypothetical protein
MQFSDRTFYVLLHPCVVIFGQRCQSVRTKKMGKAFSKYRGTED